MFLQIRPRRAGTPRLAYTGRTTARRIASALLLALTLSATTAVSADLSPSLHLRVVGGLAGVTQYTQHEQPFWAKRLEQRSGGHITAEIAPFDESGIRGPNMLQLMRLGAVPFGTALLPLVATEDPELGGIDLPGLNPDIATLRSNVAAYRPILRSVLQERHGIELLAIYSYPAQVLFCSSPFAGLSDLAGRRIRSSSLQQSDFIEGLGAMPIQTPFSEIIASVQSGTVDCAITGTMSGNSIGLHKVTSHMHGMAIEWGLSVFGANAEVWQALKASDRDFLTREIADLEREIWASAAAETEQGVVCNTGLEGCRSGTLGEMTLEPVSMRDRRFAQAVLTSVVLPRWVERCGQDCAARWHKRLGPALEARAALD